jgi:DNA-entry nuclease
VKLIKRKVYLSCDVFSKLYKTKIGDQTMKNTKRLLSIIALLLSLVMMFTSCEALDQILGQLPGVEDLPGGGTGDGTGDGTGGDEKPNPNPNPNPDPNPDDNPSGDTDTGVVEAPKADTAYKFAMVQGNKSNEVYYLSGGMAQTYYLATSATLTEAVDVYLEETDGGYYLYYLDGTTKNYINVEKVTGTDGKEHVNAKLEGTGKTVYTYDETLKTVVAAIGDATYALGTRNDKQYTTVGPCDVTKGSFVCQFYGQGGAGAPGNSDGGTGTDQSGNFDLGLIPAPDLTSSSFDGYYIVNNNVPFFTADEKATTTCFETYSSLDSLGRVGVAFACVCGNTMPTGDREGQSYKPTGWHQNTSYSGLDHLYDRSHLIAWSLAGENDTKENLATGTAYMNQHSMQIFENRVLNYLKENKSSNKVLYRVTPVFNGSNLLCSGVLMEAYSLDDGGEDIQFCVFIYNVQKGVHLDYATGKNNAASSDSDYGTGAGFGAGAGNSGSTGGNTGSGDSGNTGSGDSGNQGGTTVTPVAGDKYTISGHNANGTIYFDGTITSGRFNGTSNISDAAEVLVSTVEGGFVLSVGSKYIVMDDKSAGASFTTDAASATVFIWNDALNTYVVADPDNGRAFGCQDSSTYSNFSCYATSNTSGYNWGVYTPVE